MYGREGTRRRIVNGKEGEKGQKGWGRFGSQ
jgi:hypothetical protein